MAFRNPENCERYEYTPVYLENPIQLPANNSSQEKTGYLFSIDNTHSSEPIDWYNAYFDIDLKITEMDNTAYGAGDNASIINGGFGIIKQITVNFDALKVLDLQKTNHALNVKNLTDFSRPYSDEIAQSMLHYPDTATGAVSQEYTTIQATGNAQQITPTRSTTYNDGFTKRKTLLSAAATNNIILPLNRFGFFQSFLDQICPNGKVNFEIILESDNNVIFRDNAAGAGRFIITKFVLKVPKMIFSPSGKKLFVEKYLKSHTWTYLKEKVVSMPFTQSSGRFMIMNNIRKPRHVFIWALNSTKMNDQEQNMFVFNTYNIANARTITGAQLELSNGVLYPRRIINPTKDIAEAYRKLIEYNMGYNDYLSGSTINFKSFKDLYGILYFDLTYQETQLKEGATELVLNFQLNDDPNAEFNLYALILNEEEISVDVKSGNAVLRT